MNTEEPEPAETPEPPVDPDADTIFVCKCECGGDVRGVRDFGRLFSWCTKCSPVTKITLDRSGSFPIPKPL